jgi:hypothetical protein
MEPNPDCPEHFPRAASPAIDIDSAALIAHLTAERDRAREDAGVYKYRMEHYEREMYIYLRKYSGREPFNIEAAARRLQANTHDSWENSKDWEDLTEQEKDGWRRRVMAVMGDRA